MTTQYAWDADKDALLQETRGFGFADIITSIESGGLLDDVNHPSPNYPDQHILYVNLHEYAIAVPYVTDGETKFLKTAFYDRKANRKYLNS